MAKPIEPTPVLKGQDAEEFIRLTRQEEVSPSREKAQFLHKCYHTYLKFRNP